MTGLLRKQVAGQLERIEPRSPVGHRFPCPSPVRTKRWAGPSGTKEIGFNNRIVGTKQAGLAQRHECFILLVKRCSAHGLMRGDSMNPTIRRRDFADGSTQARLAFMDAGSGEGHNPIFDHTIARMPLEIDDMQTLHAHRPNAWHRLAEGNG